MSDPAANEETIFNVARQLSDPQDRTAYLDDACRSDEPLRERVQRLLKAEQHANEFLARDPLGLEKENTANRADKIACSAADPGATSASMTPVAPAPGDVLEDYEIIERIGGNMSLVFKARHRLLDKVVALKLLPADAITDPARLARFQRELRVLGQLEHPNLVTAADARVVGLWHMVSMEFIDGMDLERLVSVRDALTVADACEAARQATVGLQYAHQHGLIHRDIKPSNLMLTHGGTIKVIDMGLAVIQEESTGQLTQTGLVMGTMRYCAPEQFRDASRVDIRADIYSLGCTLYHLLTGKPPYSERTTLAEVVQAHLHEPFPSLSEALPGAPAELGAILARMTAKNPSARFATPGEVAEALGPFARGADLKHLLPARTSPPPARGTGSHGKAPEPSSRKSENGATARKGLRRKRTAVGVVALLLAVATIVLITMGFGRHDPVVVLMDTTAPGGVYDEDNRTGGSNAKELNIVLQEILPSHTLRPEPVSPGWHRENAILELQPHLVLAHRSLFFHPFNAVLKLGSTPFTNHADYVKWKTAYDMADDKLISLMGYVARAAPHTQFLIYSRGTDSNWVDRVARDHWAKQAETWFPELKGRIETMVVPGGTNGTFRDKKTAEDVRGRVRRILGLPEKRD